MAEIIYQPDFEYRHRYNPYHEKLGDFAEFVLRDHEGEALRGKWNELSFGRQAPLLVELGSGYGDFMMEHCQQNPSVNFVGMDYRFKRSFHVANKLKNMELKNFKFLRAKAERLEYLFAPGEVDALFCFFPDPWPKTRHHKKRLIQDHFLTIAHRILRPEGEIFIKLDYDPYADWMAEEIRKNQLFSITLESRDLYADHTNHFLSSFQTKFEKIFLSQGIKIKAFVLKAKTLAK